MLSRRFSTLTCKNAMRSHGAPARTRRPVFHAPRISETKEGKDRFSMKEAILRDRERIERNKTLPWRERLDQLKVYPWKTFICFMICWSWLGTYAVPYLKGFNRDNDSASRYSHEKNMRVSAAYSQLVTEKSKSS